MESSAQQAAQERERADLLERERQREARRARADAAAGEESALVAGLKKQVVHSRDVRVFWIAFFLAGVKDLYLDPMTDAAALAIADGDQAEAAAVSLVGSLLSGVLPMFNWWFLTSNGWFQESLIHVRLLYWLLTYFVDGIPGIKELPINVLVVLYAWVVLQQQGRQASQKLAALVNRHGKT